MKADVGDSVGLGWTGPRLRRDCAKSGSEASRLIAASLLPLALGAGLTVGPGCCAAEGAGGCGAAFVVVALGDGAGVLVAAEARGERDGYCRAAEPAALAAFDDADPIVLM